MIAGVNSDMALLCSILLSFPEVILIVPDISAKDKFKDVLITPLNKFPGFLSEPSLLHNSQIKEKFQDR